MLQVHHKFKTVQICRFSKEICFMRCKGSACLKTVPQSTTAVHCLTRWSLSQWLGLLSFASGFHKLALKINVRLWRQPDLFAESRYEKVRVWVSNTGDKKVRFVFRKWYVFKVIISQSLQRWHVFEADVPDYCSAREFSCCQWKDCQWIAKYEQEPPGNFQENCLNIQIYWNILKVFTLGHTHKRMSDYIRTNKFDNVQIYLNRKLKRMNVRITFVQEFYIYSDIQIFSDTSIHSYHICINFFIRIYLNIRLYHFYTNILHQKVQKWNGLNCSHED